MNQNPHNNMLHLLFEASSREQDCQQLYWWCGRRSGSRLYSYFSFRMTGNLAYLGLLVPLLLLLLTLAFLLVDKYVKVKVVEAVH
jgi:hypothetical protein